MEPSGPILEPPNTSSSSPRASKTIMWSSRTPQGALQQTPRSEFRAPEHFEELSSSLQGPNSELPNISMSCQAASKDRISRSQASRQASQEESKQAKQRKASKRATEQASNQSNEQTSKRANEQASKRASEQTSERTNKQASKQEVGVVPRRACNKINIESHISQSHYKETNHNP